MDFSGVLGREALAPLGKARPAQEHPFELGGWRVGLQPMVPSVVKEFVTRNLVRS